MHNKPKVSVIIATSNNMEHIADCLNSVESQSMKDIELVIVDVMSADGTKEYIEEYAEGDDSIVYLADSMGSIGRAKNIGMDHARAPYIVFVEPDDFIDYDMLTEMHTYLEEHPDTGMTTCEMDGFGSDSFGRTNKDRKDRLREANKKDPQKRERELRLFKWQVMECTAMFRRSFLYDIGIRFSEESGLSRENAPFMFLALSRMNFSMSVAPMYYKRMDIEKTIRDQAEAMVICNEYRQLRNRLRKETETWWKMRLVFWQAYYESCIRVYDRLSDDLKPILSKRMQGDIIEAIRNKEFSRQHFDILRKEEMELLLKSPAEFDAYMKAAEMERKRLRDSRALEQKTVSEEHDHQKETEIERLSRESAEATEKRRKEARLDKAWLMTEMSKDLAALRMLAGHTEDDMGILIGVSSGTYKSLENGKKKVSWDQFMALLFIFLYNARTAKIVDSLGLYPEPLKLRIKKGIIYGYG